MVAIQILQLHLLEFGGILFEGLMEYSETSLHWRLLICVM